MVIILRIEEAARLNTHNFYNIHQTKKLEEDGGGGSVVWLDSSVLLLRAKSNAE